VEAAGARANIPVGMLCGRGNMKRGQRGAGAVCFEGSSHLADCWRCTGQLGDAAAGGAITAVTRSEGVCCTCRVVPAVAAAAPMAAAADSESKLAATKGFHLSLRFFSSNMDLLEWG